MWFVRRLWNFCSVIYHPKDIYGCFRILFMFAFIFGLVPYHVSNVPKSQLRSSWLGYLNMFVRMVVYSICFMWSMIKDQSLLAYFFFTNVSRFTDSLQKFNGMFGMLIVLGMCLLYRRHLWNFINVCDRLEERFFNVGIIFVQKYSARKLNRFVIFMALTNLGFIMFGNFLIVTRSDIYPSISASISFFSPQIIVCGVVVIHYGVAHKITEYSRAIYKVLKNLSHQWENQNEMKAITHKRSLQCLDSFSMHTIVTKNPAEIIQESMEIHHLICDAASTANKYFTYQLLTIISISFLIIVFDAYYVLETLLGKSKRESKFKTIEFVTFFSSQMILYLIAIISIVEGSNRAIKKSEKTSSIVTRLINKATDVDVKEKLQQFSLQLLHMKINFTAAGLFNIDRTLYFTISGALTTYLIILLQFTSNTPNPIQNTNGACSVITNFENLTTTTTTASAIIVNN